MGQLEAANAQLKKILPQFFVTPVILYNMTYSQSNIDADETGAVSATTTIYVYIVRKDRPWNFDKAGVIEGGDAIMLTQYNQTINRGDIISWNSNTYRVQTVLDRDQLAGNISYKVCNLFKK